MILASIAVLALAVIMFSVGVVVGRSAAGGIRRGRPRRNLPPLDDSYRRLNAQIESAIERRPWRVP